MKRTSSIIGGRDDYTTKKRDKSHSWKVIGHGSYGDVITDRNTCVKIFNATVNRGEKLHSDDEETFFREAYAMKYISNLSTALGVDFHVPRLLSVQDTKKSVFEDILQQYDLSEEDTQKIYDHHENCGFTNDGYTMQMELVRNAIPMFSFTDRENPFGYIEIVAQAIWISANLFFHGLHHNDATTSNIMVRKVHGQDVQTYTIPTMNADIEDLNVQKINFNSNYKVYLIDLNLSSFGSEVYKHCAVDTKAAHLFDTPKSISTQLSANFFFDTYKKKGCFDIDQELPIIKNGKRLVDNRRHVMFYKSNSNDSTYQKRLFGIFQQIYCVLSNRPAKLTVGQATWRYKAINKLMDVASKCHDGDIFADENMIDLCQPWGIVKFLKEIVPSHKISTFEDLSASYTYSIKDWKLFEDVLSDTSKSIKLPRCN